jgi:uroporphyrinogen decarboxylase
MNESKHLLIKSISHQKVDRTPIWIMRQAGRYLPEYIKTKNRAGGFMVLLEILT